MKSNVSGSYSIANFIALPNISLWANTLMSGYLLAILALPVLSHARTSSSEKLGCIHLKVECYGSQTFVHSVPRSQISRSNKGFTCDASPMQILNLLLVCLLTTFFVFDFTAGACTILVSSTSSCKSYSSECSEHSS